jgi:hypothetical protein
MHIEECMDCVCEKVSRMKFSLGIEDYISMVSEWRNFQGTYLICKRPIENPTYFFGKEWRNRIKRRLELLLDDKATVQTGFSNLLCMQ